MTNPVGLPRRVLFFAQICGAFMKLVRGAALVGVVASRMRIWDRREIFAGRFDDDVETFTRELVTALPMAAEWQVACADDGAPIAVVAIWWRTPVAIEVNAFATDDFAKIVLPLTRWIKRVVVPHFMASGVTRAECRALADHTEAVRWLELLGARREIEIPDLGRDGETYVQMAWRKPAPTL